MKKFLYILLTFCIVMAACRPVNPPSRPGKKTQEFTTAYVQRYGQFYDSVPLNVYSLDLYSEGLKLNSHNKMEGTGWNLYLSDIFVSDVLAAGEYVSDSAAHENTFLPGMNFAGMPHGAYLLYVESDSIVQQIQVLERGSFTLEREGDTTDIRCWFVNKRDTVLKAHYRGKLKGKGFGV